MRKAVFLDRDGVLNKAIVKLGKPYPPENLNELEIIRGVKEAVLLLKQHDFLLIVVTNQPDVARGKTSKNAVETLNFRLKKQLNIDEFLTCYHDDQDNCNCRKPKPGLIVSASKNWNIDLSQSYMVGDRWRDIEAGHNAGCQTIFIDYRYCERQPKAYDFTANNLYEASKIIINGEKNG